MKKILVRTPKDESDLISTIPFFYVLREKFSEWQIITILNEGQEKFFDPLGLEMDIHVYTKKTNNFLLEMLNMHKYAYNNHDIFNIDLFFCLDNDLLSHLFGIFFRADIRVGTKKVICNKYVDSNLIKSNHFLEMINTVQQIDQSKIKILANDQGVKPKGLYEDYIIVYIEKAFDDSLKKNWVELFKLFSGQNFYLITNENNKELLKRCVNEFDQENIYDLKFIENKVNQCLPILSYAKGVITDSSHFSMIAGMTCVPIGLFYADRPYIQYGMSDIQLLELSRESVDDIHRLFKIV